MKPWWAEIDMPKPVCVNCKRFFKPASIGRFVLEQMPAGSDQAWVPYRLWSADILRCSGCGAEIVTGFGRAPVAEHYEPGFQDTLAQARATAQVIEVDDC
jgi:hypothetical protein